ncbi:hypothetical protein C9383_02800 [Pseudomonas palleroniana]|uniref:Uncharacterized protein n=1 Tax=Pseudomonas palleroniana TaxID=191390 RepID=A0A2T4G773_9PSED|nr:hypothetical protein F7R03_19760 [Pseudomonas palleroniana]PTC31545.1 hypothetical protein C9383_02800 [Pseudomonas palleroniana]
MWERACSRRRGHIQHGFRRLYRFREQARSHRGFVVSSILQRVLGFFAVSSRRKWQVTSSRS